MHIKKLFIRDFGIYNNEGLDNIASGIVVFGGMNRAGKSTLLSFLRSFAYGIEKTGNLTPAKIEYEAEVETIDAGNYYNVRLKGYSKPVVTVINSNINNSVRSDNLYGDVDYFTYSKIFTISLDELQNVEKDLEKLQAVLLGAGLSDIIKIPKIVSEYKKEAEKIGGKNGNPKTKLFKPFSSSITEGLKIKQDIDKQLHIYEKNLERLEKVNYDILKLETENVKVESERLKFELLTSNYDIYSEMQRLKYELEKQEEVHIYNKFKNEEISLEYIISLKEEYRKLLEEYNTAQMSFNNIAGTSSGNLDNFKKYSAAIKSAKASSEALKEKIKNYNSLLENSKTSRLSLSKELMDINNEWTGDFNRILEINTEELVFGQLCSDINSLKEAAAEGKDIAKATEKLIVRKSEIEEEIKNSPWKNENLTLYFIAAAVFTVLGVVICIFNKNLGVLVGGFGIIGSAVYSLIKINLLKENKKYIFDKKTELKNINRSISSKKEEADKLKLKYSELEEKTEAYRIKLCLKENVPLDSLKDYFRIIRDAKKKALELKDNFQKLSRLQTDLNIELNELCKLSITFMETLNFDEIKVRKNLIASSDYLFDSIKQLDSIVNLYQDLDNIKTLNDNLENKIRRSIAIGCNTDNVLDSLEKNIRDIKIYKIYKEKVDKYFNLESQLLHSLKNERVKKLLAEYCDNVQEDKTSEELNEKFLNAFYSIVQNYISLDEIISDGKTLEEKLAANRMLLEKLKEDRLNINKENQDIYDNDNLKLAQNKIESGRRELKVLAEKYAVYNAAAFILETMQKNFIEKTKDSLLVGAEEILSEITGGEYVSILPQEDLTKCDFITVEKEGTIKDSTAILSRGTKEQLFLAVRLSRIKEIKEKLPIIIDDSLVNFDMEHLKNVIKVLKAMSAENQIFILTCHPEVVSSIMEQDDNAKYYEIDKGKFSESTGKKLLKKLAVEQN